MPILHGGDGEAAGERGAVVIGKMGDWIGWNSEVGSLLGLGAKWLGRINENVQISKSLK
ncbi:hypothetical protein EMIT0P265_20090 [Pseudomonas zeae]